MVYIRAVGKLFTGYSSLSNRQGGRSPTSKGWGGRFQFFDFTTMGTPGSYLAQSAILVTELQVKLDQN